jgi:hypothetical protein
LQLAAGPHVGPGVDHRRGNQLGHRADDGLGAGHLANAFGDELGHAIDVAVGAVVDDQDVHARLLRAAAAPGLLPTWAILVWHRRLVQQRDGGVSIAVDEGSFWENDFLNGHWGCKTTPDPAGHPESKL